MLTAAGKLSRLAGLVWACFCLRTVQWPFRAEHNPIDPDRRVHL